MAKKIYLSAAAHATDNPTKCPQSCGENTHCNQYMDIVERRLKALGFEVKRGDKSKVGSAAMSTRVSEANKWKADLYYVAHTNAGGGRYSMTMCWNDAASKAKANVIHKYRKCVASHKVVTRNDLYEIKQTAMTCLYDELFFHDNAEDCAWFHNGGMALLAEETVQAICEICGVAYKPEVKEEPKKEAPAKKPTPAPTPAPVAPVAKPATKPAPKAGDVVNLNKGKLYASARGSAAVTRTGTFYLYDGIAVNGRYRVTNAKSRVGKTPIALNVSGWVEM